MSDKVTAYLRTVVPAVWGSLVVWLVAQMPALPEPVIEWLNSEATIAVVTALAILGWYWLWRKVENRIPEWLIRIVLGSSKSPTYDGGAAVVYELDNPEDTSTA